MVTLSSVLTVFIENPRPWCESELAEHLGVEISQLKPLLDHLLHMGRLVVQEAAEACDICPLHSSCLLLTTSQQTYTLAPNEEEKVTVRGPTSTSETIDQAIAVKNR